MIEVIFFGRGGQGAVTAAQMLATGAFREGKMAQAFPSFGPERRGAPVTAYARISDGPIVDRSQITQADVVIVLDPKVLRTASPLRALKKKGCAILNVAQPAEEIRREMDDQDMEIHCIDASAISEEVYGQRAIPITNVAMLGALAAITGLIGFETVLATVDQFFSGEGAETSKETARLARKALEGIEPHE